MSHRYRPAHRARRRRTAPPVLVGLTGLALIAAGGLLGSGRAVASTDATPVAAASPSVTLNGEGTWDVDAEINGWQQDTYGAKGAMTLNYVEQSGQAGREDMLGGVVDYAIAGAPFSPSELSATKSGAAGVIAAPVMPSAVGFLLNPPDGGFTIQDNQGNFGPPYAGQVREPVANVAAQILHYTATNQQVDPNGTYNPHPGTNASSYLVWDNPDIVSTWDQSFLSGYNPAAGDYFEPNDTAGVADSSPQQVIQAQPSEDNLYLDEWVAEQDPGFWAKLQAASGDAATFTPSESPQPTLSVTERPGLQQVIQTVASGTLTGHANTAGLVAPVPPASLDEVLAQEKTAPAAGLNDEWIAVKNAAGQWETPTPQTIDAAIDATPSPSPTATSGAEPLYPSVAPVSGAYPLTYVDYLYAPATGLSVAKTEGLATLIRYLATDGQNELAGHGDGRLSPTLVAQALDAANRLVESNCPAAGGQIVLTSSPGPYAPALPGIEALGPVYHCQPAPAAPAHATTTTTTKTRTTTTTSTRRTTTTTPPTAPSGGGFTTPVTSPPSASPTTASGAGAPAPGRSGPTTVPSTTTTTQPKIYAQDISALPLPVVGSTSAGLDKVGALLVGVALFLLLRRRPAAWLQKLVHG